MRTGAGRQADVSRKGSRFLQKTDEKQEEKPVSLTSQPFKQHQSFPACPSCGSFEIVKNGFRTLNDGTETQLLKCQICERNFAESYIRFGKQREKHQLCALQEAKKLDTTTEKETVTWDIENKLKEYHINMKINGYAEATINLSWSILEILTKRGADLRKPKTVKEVISEQNWSDNRRRNVINAYSQFLKYLGLSWEAPICNVTRKLPFIPTTEEVNDLIAGCSVPVATFLQLLFETAMRSGEAIRLRWIDVDFERKIIRCNNPEKGSEPRIFSNISGKLLSMLNAMPRKNDLVFAGSTAYSLKATFTRSRKRLAFKLQNPRLKAIHFHTLRHFRATLEYHRTKDLLHVQHFLGHREVKNTMLYIQLDKELFQNFNEDQFNTRIAHNAEEACKLIDVGFEYVTGEYNDGGKIFRKRK
jgi:integrase